MTMENLAFILAKTLKIILIVCSALYLYRAFYIILGFGNKIRFRHAEKNNKFAVLIPARNESKVISDLLCALRAQSYDKTKFDVYVIVKDKEDETIKIATDFGYKTVINTTQTCKGDALDSAIKKIYAENLQYDAFLIFDADNIPVDNFLFEMNKALDAGYDIGMGYRNSKNWNDGWVASCSGLTFSLINSLSNKGRTKLGLNNIFSGTGYYIKQSVLQNFGGWPFKTLTEDYEISMFATLNNLKTTYVEKAEYFDEQPVDLKTSYNQRVRWVKGFLSTRKIYSNKIMKGIFTDKNNKLSKIEQTVGIMPLVIALVSCILFALTQIVFTIIALTNGQTAFFYIKEFLTVTIGMYLAMVFLTALELMVENKRINISFSSKCLCLLMNPFFMAMYIPIALKAIFTKTVSWKTIVHTRSLKEIGEEEPIEQVAEVVDTKRNK